MKKKKFSNNVILTADDFLDLKVSHSFRTVRAWASWVIVQYGCDFDRLVSDAADEARFFNPELVAPYWDYNCDYLYAGWNYEKVSPIQITSDGLVSDGHHRCLALGCLLLEKKVRYEPVEYWVNEGGTGCEYVYGCCPFPLLQDARLRGWRSPAEVEYLLARVRSEPLVDMEADVFQPFA